MSALLAAFLSKDRQSLCNVRGFILGGQAYAAASDGAVFVVDMTAPIPSEMHTDSVCRAIGDYLDLPTVKIGAIKSSDLAKQIKPLAPEPCGCFSTVCLHSDRFPKKPMGRPNNALRIGPAVVDCATLRKLLSKAPAGKIDIQATDALNPVFMCVPGKWLAIVMPLRPSVVSEGLSRETALKI